MHIDPQPELDPESYERAVPRHAHLIKMARSCPP